MGEVKEEIKNAIKVLSLAPSDITLLDSSLGEALYDELLKTFVRSCDRRWWWEDFKTDSISIDFSKYSYNYLEKLIPSSDNNVWFMVEDDQEEFYPIYDSSTKVIASILDECFRFEYYIISKDKKWLICENHHGRLIGVGELPEFDSVFK